MTLPGVILSILGVLFGTLILGIAVDLWLDSGATKSTTVGDSMWTGTIVVVLLSAMIGIVSFFARAF